MEVKNHYWGHLNLGNWVGYPKYLCINTGAIWEAEWGFWKMRARISNPSSAHTRRWKILFVVIIMI